MKQLFCSVAILVFLFKFDIGSGQTTWKKDVCRIVPFNENAKKAKKSDTSLSQLLIYDALQNRITPYANMDQFFTIKLGTEQLRRLTETRVDTSMVIDPKTGKEKIVITKRESRDVEKYYLHEKWMFDPANFKAWIQIEGIAPVKTIYNSDGSYRAMQAMLWFRYDEVVPAITSYTIKHPDCDLVHEIWKDYLKNMGLNPDTGSSGGIQTVLVSRMINLQIPDDTVLRHLPDISVDTSYMEILLDRLKEGRLTIYKDSDMHNTLSLQEFHKLYESRTDTTTVIDPENGREIVRVNVRTVDPTYFTKYKLLEVWSFNPQKGAIVSQVIGVAPILEKYDLDGNLKETPMFWVRLDDFKTMLSLHDEYHPKYTLADLIWEDYFKTPQYLH